MSEVNCKKCVHYNFEPTCEKCVHWDKLTDNYVPKTYEHLCSICGMRWFDENVQDPEYCPQCKHKMEELNV